MISREEVMNLATLARLELPKAEVDKLRQDLDAVLDYVAKLKVEATDLEPKLEASSDTRHILRPDISPHEAGIHMESLLKASPETRDGYFVVKPIFPQDDH